MLETRKTQGDKYFVEEGNIVLILKFWDVILLILKV